MKTLSATWSRKYFLIAGETWICHPCLGTWIQIGFIGHSSALENEIEMEIWNAFSSNGVGIKICIFSLMEQKSLSSPCGCSSPHWRTDLHCSNCWRMMNPQILASSLIMEIPLILWMAQVSPPHPKLEAICGRYHGRNFWAHPLTLFPWTLLEDL